jgi:nitrite reductase (NO-forming)
MWETARAKLRDWYIVVIALVLIGAAFFSPRISRRRRRRPRPSIQPVQRPLLKRRRPSTRWLRQRLLHRRLPANPPPSAPAAPPKAPQQAVQPSSGDAHAATHTMAATEPQTHAQAPGGVGAPPPAGGNAAAGRLVFRKCQACHSIEAGKALLGPSLAGIVGRKAGAEASYNYSPAMKQANIVWDAKTLDAYLADSQKVVPGNKMPFPGLKTEQDRADVIAYFAGAGGAQAAAAAPGNAPAPAPRRPLQAIKPPHKQIKHRSRRPAPASSMCRMPTTPCVPASPKAAWSISASAARSTARSTRS